MTNPSVDTRIFCVCPFFPSGVLFRLLEGLVYRSGCHLGIRRGRYVAAGGQPVAKTQKMSFTAVLETFIILLSTA